MATNWKPALLIVPALALAGCVSTAPEPSPSTSAPACDPASSEISWSEASEGIEVPVGAEIITYSENATVRTVDIVANEREKVWDDDALDTLAAGDETLRAAWQEELVDDLGRTGQFGDNLGEQPVLPTEPTGTPTDPVDGSYVVAIVSKLRTATFTVDCGGRQVEGSLGIVDPQELGYISLDCDPANYPDADEVTSYALEQCPA